MNRFDEFGAKGKHETLVHALLILPAVVLGVLAMVHGGVSPALWGQQLAAWTVFALAAWLTGRKAAKVSPAVWGALLLLMLAVTLFGGEAGGARRWVNLIVFHVNAAHLVLPALIDVLYRMKRPLPALLCAAAVLCVQPDIVQLIALAAAAVPLLMRQGKRAAFAGVPALSALVLGCMRMPVSLETVPYSEGILAMLGGVSWLAKAAGWAALAAVPAYWLCGYAKRREARMLSLALYYAAALLPAFGGKAPVLLMGFGLSPIAGYFLSYIAGAAGRKDA